MKRIMIIGCGGVGKSTLARKIHRLLDIPIYHLDLLFWKAGWQQPETKDWEEKQRKLCQEESWIIDGNYGSSIDIRMAKADTIIYLDFPRWRCLYGVIKRRIQHHGKTRPDMTEGCQERLDPTFLKWIWNYHRNSRPILLEKIAKLPSDKNLVQLTSHKEVKSWLDRLNQETLTMLPNKT